eukprot:2449254-Pleurochrysis_carterae.AAC.2
MTTASGHRCASPTSALMIAPPPRLLPRSTRSTLSASQPASSKRGNAASTQENLERPSYKNGNFPSLPLTVKAVDELWRHAFHNNMVRRQDLPQRSRGDNCVDAMHVNTASDIDDDESAAV